MVKNLQGRIFLVVTRWHILFSKHMDVYDSCRIFYRWVCLSFPTSSLLPGTNLQTNEAKNRLQYLNFRWIFFSLNYLFFTLLMEGFESWTKFFHVFWPLATAQVRMLITYSAVNEIEIFVRIILYCSKIAE